MGFFSDLWKGFKDAFTGNPFGAVTSVASGLSSIGATKRQKKLMDYQDQINDENYARAASSVDLEEIRSVAIGELGMRYAKEGQIINVSGEGSDYVRQLAQIQE